MFLNLIGQQGIGLYDSFDWTISRPTWKYITKQKLRLDRGRLIWTHGETELLEFTDWLNLLSNSIKFTISFFWTWLTDVFCQPDWFCYDSRSHEVFATLRPHILNTVWSVIWSGSRAGWLQVTCESKRSARRARSLLVVKRVGKLLAQLANSIKNMERALRSRREIGLLCN